MKKIIMILSLSFVFFGCGYETADLEYDYFIVTSIERCDNHSNYYYSDKDMAGVHDNFFGSHDTRVLAPRGYTIGDTLLLQPKKQNIKQQILTLTPN